MLAALAVAACGGLSGAGWDDVVYDEALAGPVPSRWVGDAATGEGVTLVWGGVEGGLVGRTFLALPVRFRVPGTEAARSESRALDGVIGRELLRRFTLVLDHPHERVALLPTSEESES